MENLLKQNGRVLIVDDEPSNVEMLKEILLEFGYEHVMSTTDSRLVVGLYETFCPDLILLDLMMPHLDGFEVMEQLKTLIPRETYFPILVLTADISHETKLRALSGGAKDFLSKPFDIYELQLRILNLLETRYLHHLLKNQNQILEEKVKERTNELELTNSELIIARDKAQQSDRLKTAFLNNISHEIRTPLNGIVGFAPFVIQPDVSQEDKEEYLAVLNESSERLVNTIDDYMDISLIVSGCMVVKPLAVNLASLLQQLSDKFTHPCARKNLEFRTDHTAFLDELNFVTDKYLLVKALSQLLSNSLKFTSNGCITLGCELKNEHLLFSVKDTGVGIAPDAQQRILDIFMQENYSRTRKYEGSGLGLSIANGIINLLGGKISLESELDRGTSVYITLPFKGVGV